MHEQELHPCLITYGECSFGPNCLYTDAPRDACIYFLKGKCSNPKASVCNNGKHYPALAEKMKDAQAALFASGSGITPRIPKKVWRPHGSHGWKVGGLFCTRCGVGLTTPDAKVLCKNAPADYKDEDPVEQTEGTKAVSEVGNNKQPCRFFRTGHCLAENCSYSHARPQAESNRGYVGDSSKRRRDRRERSAPDAFQTFNIANTRDNGFVTHDLAPEGPSGEWLQSGKRVRRPSRMEDYDLRRPSREDYEIDRPRPREVIGGLGIQGPRVDVLPAIQSKGRFY